MRVFVAGGAGVLGRRLVPQLVARGHEVTATTTSAAKLDLLAQLGADGVVMDGLDAVSVGEAVATAQPDTIVHQMTGLSLAHAGKPDLKHFDRWAAPTIRLRTEGTDHLLAAAEAAGVPHIVAQGYANWNGIREGGWVKTEEDPLDVLEGTRRRRRCALSATSRRRSRRAGGAVMRYGGLYGPSAPPTTRSSWSASGSSRWSAARPATHRGCTSMTRRAPPCWRSNSGRGACSTSSTTSPRRRASGCRTWPTCAGAKRPMRMPAWLARMVAGEVAVIMMTQGRGFSNAKAKRELGWELRYPSWREGFKTVTDQPSQSSPV